MRKKIVSLCMALALCLGLLPATALAAGEDAPDTLYVGETQITGSGYWITDANGKLAAGDASNYDVYYDGNGTLTLNNAKIQGRGYSGNPQPEDYGIYAAPTGNQSVSLTINLMGRNTVSGYCGICVETATADNASLVIQPAENDPQGSLEAIGNKYNGITISSDSGNASLTINNAPVVAISESPAPNSYHGVCIKTGNATAPALSLLVNGGSLTAQGESGYGIYFYMGNSTTDPSTSLTIQNNALVKATPSIFTSNNLSKPDTTAGSESGGIVFDGNSGTVYGDVTLDESLTINQGETLTIGKDASLTVPDGKTLTNKGTVTTDGGTFTNNGKIENSGTLPSNIGGTAPPSITTTSLAGGTVGTAYTAPLAASGTGTITWSNSGNLPAGLTLDENTGVISGTPTAQGTSNFTVTASNNGGSDSKPLSITISSATNIPVQSVSLDKTSLELTEGGTGTLIATVEPNNATNKNVTWSTSNASIATVNNGEVTAVSAGTATITVTTEDGSGKTAACTVTVKHGNMVHTAKQDATCTEAGHTAYWYCSGCQKYFSDENGTTEITQESTVIPAAGHTFRGGWCAVCGARDPNYVPPANPNYRVDVTATEGGAVTKNPAAAKAGETVTLTPTPEEGYEVGNVTVTDRFGDAVEVTENADGTYTFTMPNGQVRVEVTFVEATPEPLPFTDVNEGAWFHDAVRYVYDNGLMDGVGDGQFAPNATTNRAMVVTILYRLAGEPAVSGDAAFTDVESGLWYSNAVLWAAQNGIVNGISETEFAPAGDLTREQLATILYRYAESMGYDVSAQADLSGFPDAGDIQDYATEALSWAVAEGLLQGFEDDSLQPGGTATRAQIATILMRFLAAAPTA